MRWLHGYMYNDPILLCLSSFQTMKNNTHGGARLGSGRPKSKEEMAIIYKRVPKRLREQLLAMLVHFIKTNQLPPHPGK